MKFLFSLIAILLFEGCSATIKDRNWIKKDYSTIESKEILNSTGEVFKDFLTKMASTTTFFKHWMFEIKSLFILSLKVTYADKIVLYQRMDDFLTNVTENFTTQALEKRFEPEFQLAATEFISQYKNEVKYWIDKAGTNSEVINCWNTHKSSLVEHIRFLAGLYDKTYGTIFPDFYLKVTVLNMNIYSIVEKQINLIKPICLNITCTTEQDCDKVKKECIQAFVSFVFLYFAIM